MSRSAGHGWRPQLLEAGGSLEGFVVTLPKITSVDQVEAMNALVGRVEDSLGLDSRSLGFELQIETSQSIAVRTGRRWWPV